MELRRVNYPRPPAAIIGVDEIVVITAILAVVIVIITNPSYQVLLGD